MLKRKTKNSENIISKEKEEEALRCLYRDFILHEAENIGTNEKGKPVLPYEIFAKTLKANGFITDEVLLPMGYISLPEYCKKHGYDKKKIKGFLDAGKMHGIMKDGIWHMDENEPVESD